MNTKSKKYIFGLIGLLFGFAAIIVAAFQHELREKSPVVKEDKRSLKELAVEAGKKAIKEKFLGESKKEPKKAVEPQKEKSDIITIVYYLLGIIAIFFGIISYIKKEHIRLSIATFSCGSERISKNETRVNLHFLTAY